MIKKKDRFNKKTKFGRDPVVPKTNILETLNTFKPKKKKWKSIINLSCKSAEFNDINGIDFFYRVFHHDRKNKEKLKEIINDINRENDDDDEKIITGQTLLKFTPIIYRLTKDMIKENTKEYRKFQKSNYNIDKLGFKNWWSEAHNNSESNRGITKVLLSLRKFWAVFFSSFRNFKNFQEFERTVLGGHDKLSTDYSKYVIRLTKYGVPKFIDTNSITSTHHDNHIKVFTDWSVFSEIWRLNKPIFCTYRTLFIQCTSGIYNSDKCPFNNWDTFNFKTLNEEELDDITEYVGDLVMQNDKFSIVGNIETVDDWTYEETNRMFERDNPFDRARLLDTAKSIANKSKHSHGVDGSKGHTHTTNPIYSNSERFLEDKIRSDSQMINANLRMYGENGVNVGDPDLTGILAGRTEKKRRQSELTKSQDNKRNHRY
jgi:hypothetical protein|tara:strand:+ start:2802 stop:4091 length:1290 start_codon:yes stop_codon:yes gene_type:complete